MATANEILQAAAGHMQDRAATYDKPEGERSMGATVEAFKAVTGHLLTEEQGWLFMALLKAVRSQQGALRMDSYEDGAAYFSLAGEAASAHRKKPLKRVLYDDDTEARMGVVGQNGPTAEHYDGWVTHVGGGRPVPPDVMVAYKMRDGAEHKVHAGRLRWDHKGLVGDIVAYKVVGP